MNRSNFVLTLERILTIPANLIRSGRRTSAIGLRKQIRLPCGTKERGKTGRALLKLNRRCPTCRNRPCGWRFPIERLHKPTLTNCLEPFYQQVGNPMRRIHLVRAKVEKSSMSACHSSKCTITEQALDQNPMSLKAQPSTTAWTFSGVICQAGSAAFVMVNCVRCVIKQTFGTGSMRIVGEIRSIILELRAQQRPILAQ